MGETKANQNRKNGVVKKSLSSAPLQRFWRKIPLSRKVSTAFSPTRSSTFARL